HRVRRQVHTTLTCTHASAPIRGVSYGGTAHWYPREDVEGRMWREKGLDMEEMDWSFFAATNDVELLREGKISLPIPTFILGPTRPEEAQYYPDQEGCEVAPNLTFLGKRGIMTGASGLKLAYFGGLEGQQGDSTHFSYQDLKDFLIQTRVALDTGAVDILMTSQWPENVTRFAEAPKAGTFDPSACSKHLVTLAQTLKPRQVYLFTIRRLCRVLYYFAGGQACNYERLPYRNHVVLQGKDQHVTRFISLAPVSNKEKQKWLYAFSLIPMSKIPREELIAQPPDVTESPFAPSGSVPTGNWRDEDEGPQQQFFYDMSRGRGRGGAIKRALGLPQGRPEPNPPPRKKRIPEGPCWFCLGSPEVEKHLVVTVGETLYVALPKGPLVDGHVMIIPIAHEESGVTLEPATEKEIEIYKKALTACFAKEGKDVVFWERNYRQVHMQVHVCPIPKAVGEVFTDLFIEEAAQVGCEMIPLPKHTDIRQLAPPGAAYFLIESPTGEKLYLKISGVVGLKFPLQLARDILCKPSCLNVPERRDWRKLVYSKEEEAEMTEKFRKKFSLYDPSETVDDA
ncbi:unnamed protein product, partial [Cyprideis torosa]